MLCMRSEIPTDMAKDFESSRFAFCSTERLPPKCTCMGGGGGWFGGLKGNVVIVPVFLIQFQMQSKNEIRTNCRYNAKTEIKSRSNHPRSRPVSLCVKVEAKFIRVTEEARDCDPIL